MVFVGTRPGLYDEEYDVGRQTSFVYSGARSGQRYYFSVAAYSPGPVLGPRSAPISYIAGAPSPQATASLAPQAAAEAGADTPAADAEPPDRGANAAACAGNRGDDCYAVRTRLRTSGRVQALAVAPDGRVFAIADGRSVLVHATTGDAARASLVVDDRVLAGLAIDPAFATNHFVYVGEVEDGRRSGLEMAVVRYRELRGVLGERAAIVSGIPVPTRAGAPFTLDAGGNIYIAVPHDERRARDPYARAILRLAPDGTVHRDAPGMSPVFAQGITDPVSLAWTPQGRLWTTGMHLLAPQIAYASTGPTESWPRPLSAAALETAAAAQTPGTQPQIGPLTFLPTSAGALVRCDAASLPSCSPIALERGEITAVASDSTIVYVAAADDDGTSSILELRRAN